MDRMDNTNLVQINDILVNEFGDYASYVVR